MSWRTNTAVLWARNAGRTVGLNRVLARFGDKGYERKYDEQLTSRIHPGDTVWDVGANVGYYVAQFSRLVGPRGTVVAFEPSARNFQRLQAACASLPNVRLRPCGLGNVRGRVHFQQGADDLGATSKVVDGAGADVVEIEVGDRLVAAGTAPPPNAIKIDVEGFEGEVIEGLATCINSPALRVVGVEVHFGILAQRGLGHVPRTIEGTLAAAGLTVGWPDKSHLLATR